MERVKEVLSFIVIALALGLVFHYVFNEGIDKMNDMPVKDLQYQMDKAQ